MLGCMAAVSATESPSQLSPALIQRMWIVGLSSAGVPVASSAPTVFAFASVMGTASWGGLG